MFGLKENKDPWRNGVYLTTADSTLQAGILESKLAAENIPCLKRYEGASNFLEIYMGVSTVFPVEIYVPEDMLEKAKEVIKPVPIDDDFEEVSEEELLADEVTDLWERAGYAPAGSEDGTVEAEDGADADKRTAPRAETRKHGRQRKVQNREGQSAKPGRQRRRRTR